MRVVLNDVVVTAMVFKQTPLTQPETMLATRAVWTSHSINLQRKGYDCP